MKIKAKRHGSGYRVYYAGGRSKKYFDVCSDILEVFRIERSDVQAQPKELVIGVFKSMAAWRIMCYLDDSFGETVLKVITKDGDLEAYLSKEAFAALKTRFGRRFYIRPVSAHWE